MKGLFIKIISISLLLFSLFAIGTQAKDASYAPHGTALAEENSVSAESGNEALGATAETDTENENEVPGAETDSENEALGAKTDAENEKEMPGATAETDSENEVPGAETDSGNENEVPGAETDSGNEALGATAETDTENGSRDGGSSEAESSVTETGKIYELILTHVSGIISLFTLAISVILTNFHKKKLMPTLGGALGSIGDSVRSLGERAEVSLAAAEETARRMSAKIENMDGVIESFNFALSEMEKRMCELEEHRINGESIKIMMRTEVEELYKIFTASDMSEVNRKTVEEKLTVIKSHLES